MHIALISDIHLSRARPYFHLNWELLLEALAEDRTAQWARIGGASFLSDEEKRRLLGVGQ